MMDTISNIINDQPDFDFFSELTEFITLHTAPSSRGHKALYTIVTNGVATDMIGEICRSIQITPHYFYPTEDYQGVQKILSSIIQSLSEGKVVFFFLNEELFDYLYSNLMAWRDRQYFATTSRIDTLTNMTSSSKARLFLILRTDPASINLEMISKLSDYTLMDSI